VVEVVELVVVVVGAVVVVGMDVVVLLVVVVVGSVVVVVVGSVVVVVVHCVQDPPQSTPSSSLFMTPSEQVPQSMTSTVISRGLNLERERTRE
jgi:hypothetical protein